MRDNPHGDPVMRRLGRGVRKAVGASAATGVRTASDLTDRLGRPVPSSRRIVVSSIRGGAGKSTMAALVARAIQKHRDDRVLAIDADPGLGSLPLRLGVTSSRSVRDLATARPQSWPEAAAYLAKPSDGPWVLSGTPDGEVGDDLEHEVFKTGAARLSRYFSVSVIDCGAGLVSGLHRGILSSAHAQVFVVPGTGDGAISARASLDWFHRNGYADLLTRTVVALVSHTASSDADMERARAYLAEGGWTVVHVPYDRHLATGTAISFDRVAAATIEVTTTIAAEAFTHALSGGTT